MRNLLFILLIFVGIVSSCRKYDNFFEADFSIADSLMFVNPSEALIILEKYSSLGDRMHGEDKARYALLMTQAKARNNIKQESDSQINVAIEYYTRHLNRERLAWSYLYRCNINEQLGNDSIAIFSVRKAKKLASDIENYRLHYYIHVFWSNIVKYRSPYIDGLKQFEMANKYAVLCVDTSGIIWSLNGIASSLVYMKDFNEARRVFREAKSTSIDLNKLDGINNICNGIAFTYYMQDSLLRADEALDEALLWSRKNNLDSSYSCELKRGILIKMGKYDDARDYVVDSMDSSDYRRYGSYCLDMSRIEEGSGNLLKALDYHKRYAASLDSLHKEDVASRVLEWQKKYDVMEVAAERDRIRAYSRGVWLIVAVLVMTVLMMILWFVKRIQRKNMELKLVALAKDKAMSESIELMRNRADDMLRSHIDNENRLKEYIYDTDHVINKIRRLKNLGKTERVSEPSGKFSLSDEEIESLMMTVDVCHNGFMGYILREHGPLSDEDQVLICLLKLGLQNRDIAPLLNVSDNTLKKRKRRLKDKLGVEDEAISLDDWIMNKTYGGRTAGH